MTRWRSRLTEVHGWGMGGGSIGGQGGAPGGAGGTSGTGGVGHGGSPGDFYSPGDSESRSKAQARTAATARSRAAANAARARQQAEQRANQKAARDLAQARQQEQDAARKGGGFLSGLISGAKKDARDAAGTAALSGLGAIVLGLNPVTAVGMALGKSLLGGLTGRVQDKAEGVAGTAVENVVSGITGALRGAPAFEGTRGGAGRAPLGFGDQGVGRTRADAPAPSGAEGGPDAAAAGRAPVQQAAAAPPPAASKAQVFDPFAKQETMAGGSVSLTDARRSPAWLSELRALNADMAKRQRVRQQAAPAAPPMYGAARPVGFF